MKKFWLMLSLAPAVLGCAAVSNASVTAREVPLTPCDIKTDYAKGILSLDGEVYGREGETGHYRFVLSRQGAGGSSDVQQSGDYVVEPGGQVSVMSTQVSLGRHDHYSAVLEVETEEGRFTCHAS